MAAVVPEALTAAARLTQPALAADSTCVTSPGLLHRAVRARQGHKPAQSRIPGQIVPAAPRRTARRTPTASRPPNRIMASAGPDPLRPVRLTRESLPPPPPRRR